MSNLNLPTMTYSNLTRVMGDRDTKVLAYKTLAVLTPTSDEVVVFHHDSVIARIFQDGGLAVTSGGWRSSTTKGRLNQILSDNSTNYRIFQKNYQWFVRNTETKRIIEWEGVLYVTSDGQAVDGWH